jgi:hypothetical protein
VERVPMVIARMEIAAVTAPMGNARRAIVGQSIR